MKSLRTKMTIAAAALLVAAGTVSAQNSMKAEIPFGFQANGVNMPAGAYRVTAGFGSPSVIKVVAEDSSRGALLVSNMRIGKDWSTEAKLVFRCIGSDCALQQVWTGTPGANYQVPAPRSHDKELAAVRIISVRLQ